MVRKNIALRKSILSVILVKVSLLRVFGGNMNKDTFDIIHNSKPRHTQPVGKIIKKWADDANIRAEYFEKIESTNVYARNTNVSLVITDKQTHGRGRGNNQWICPQYGDCFLTTWIFITSRSVQPIFSPLVGLALYRAFHKTWEFKIDLSLKALTIFV